MMLPSWTVLWSVLLVAGCSDASSRRHEKIIETLDVLPLPPQFELPPLIHIHEMDSDSSAHSSFHDAMADLINPLMAGNVHFHPSLTIDWNLKGASLWWMGENVCVSEEEKVLGAEEEEEEEGKGGVTRHTFFVSTMCHETETAHKCIIRLGGFGREKVVTKIHQCCHGYEREKGKSGCTKEVEMKDLVETMQRLGTTEFVEAMRGIGLTKRHLRHANYTIFAPTNGALQEADLQSVVSNSVLRGDIVRTSRDLEIAAGKVKDIIASHVFAGIHPSSLLANEQVIEPLNSNGNVRINFYAVPNTWPREQIMTANCVPVNSTDNMATNGIVHVVDKIIMPAKFTLHQLVENNQEFNTLKHMLDDADMTSDLRQPGQYTLFAPTNHALSKLLRPQVADRFTRNRKCLKNLLRSLLLPNVVCTAAVPEGSVSSRSRLQTAVKLERLADGRVKLNDDALLQQTDVMATNGVLHGIDKVTLPLAAMSVVEAAEEAGAKQFAQLLRGAAIDTQLTEMTDFTLFLPTDEAIEAIPEADRRRLFADPEKVKDVLLFHVSPAVHFREDLRNDARLATLHGDKKILIRELRPWMSWMGRRQTTVQCTARLVGKQLQSCGAIIHRIDKLLLPPVGDAVQVLEKDGRFSRFVALLRKANLVEELRDANAPVTIFAPTNEAFERLTGDQLEQMESVAQLKTMLQNHITYGVQCCMGITPLLGRYRRTLAGSRVNMRVSRGVSVVDRVPIAECDLMADNGVVHVVERVLPSATRALSGRRRHRLGQTLGHHLHRWWQLPSDIRRWFNN